MSETSQSLKSIFKQEQQNRGNDIIDEAQRLVNLYRHAESFGEEFMAKLDDMLLAASPEVQTALSDILGGQVVRQYCLFLKDRKMPKEEEQVEENAKDVSKQEGYLPKPTAAAPMVAGESGIDAAALEVIFQNFLKAHQEELTELLKAQSETMSTLLKRFDQNTHEVASHQTDRLINALQQETGKQKKYSDIIESTAQTPVLVPDETEGF